jgi:succinate dehydrogenase hydrophobic anchor subunit
LAGLFAAFACLYALNYIPFNEATVEWHLWLSLVGAALFGLGFTLFAMLTPENTVREPSHGALVAAATGLFVGPALFTATQLLFVMALIHGVLAMRHR